MTEFRTQLARSIAFLLVLAGCGPSAPPQHYGYLALLGRDTVSIESVTRTGNTVVSDEMDKFPRVRRRHTEIKLAADGSIRRLDMTIRTPSEPSSERVRHVVVDVSPSDVTITKSDSTGEKHLSFPTHGALTMAQLPQMYSLTDLYLHAALAHDTVPPHAGDVIKLRQFYIDREFDKFPLGSGVVKLMSPSKVEFEHDWLAGTAEATLDSNHEMQTYSGARTTYKVEVKRLTGTMPDIEAIGERFAAAETKSGGASELSVRDTARATVGNATMFVDYGRPLARGRVLLGNIIPYNSVWRTGANAATQFSTSVPITLAGLKLAPGMYTLWTVPTEKGADLIVNKQSGQWGTEYNHANDLGRAPMTTAVNDAPVEKMQISIVPVDARHGTLVIEWGPFRWTAGIVVL